MIKYIKAAISSFLACHTFISWLAWLIDWILRIAGIWYLSTFIGWFPGYTCEWHKDKSIFPYPNLFSGQSVKLDFDLYGNVTRRDIETVKWNLSKGFTTFATSNELTPTFPLTEGGIFQLTVHAKISDGSTIIGKSNLNVIEVQNIPFKAEEPTTILLKAQNNTPAQIKNIQSKGIEVYAGDGRWKSMYNISVTPDNAIIKLETNESIPTFNGQILYRVKDSVNKLSDFGTVKVQKNIDSAN